MADIVLSLDQMRQIARYELTFEPFIKQKLSFTCKQDYTFTADDLRELLANLKRADPILAAFETFWMKPMQKLSKHFGLKKVFDSILYADEDEDSEAYEYSPLLLTDEAYIFQVFNDLYMLLNHLPHEAHFSDLYFLEYWLEDLNLHLANRDKPVLERQFSESRMQNYIQRFKQDIALAKATDNEVALCRKFIEALIPSDNKAALDLKGYACYGGSRLYPCDWNASRDCMLKLFELTDDPSYSNTLGYIYYYGRCSGGVPDYDNAFRYFSVGAACTVYESSYKLADMFANGYGCIKSPHAAKILYVATYHNSQAGFLNGDDNSPFADAALRMGHVHARGIDEEIDWEEAYFYYLQADCAARIRTRVSDFFGDKTVLINIRKALDEAEEALDSDFFEDTETVVPHWFEQLVEDRYDAELFHKQDAFGNHILSARRFLKAPAILVTIPALKYCERTHQVSYTTIGESECWFENDAERIRYDAASYNYSMSRYEFFHEDHLIGWIKSESYHFNHEGLPEAFGAEHRIAQICFLPGGRTYDYLCELDDVHIGDRVIVAGYDGETEVTVVNVVTKRESELALPIERYKKVLRKA